MKKKTLFMVLGMVLFFGLPLLAGTTDNLGLQGTWTTVQNWFSDGYIMKIISMALLIFSIMMFTRKDYIFGLLILVIDVVISNLTTVIDKFASAIF